jgi:hypothetical protein
MILFPNSYVLYNTRLGLPLTRSGFIIAISTLLLIFGTTSNATPTSAQIPSIPSFPDNDDGAITSDSQSPPSAGVNSPLPPNIPPPTIEITSPQDGQQVPIGELTIEGISSDDEEKDCQVYADVNDVTPMRNVTTVGDNGEENDFSKWSFTYTEDYQLIKEGLNELTAKISCFATNNPTPLSEWHTINVTGGAAGQPAVTSPTEEGPVPDTDADEGEEDTSLFG